MSFTVAIVGRPNVGKSTLFNRLLEQRKAIVDDESGVTRDRQYGVAEWSGRNFNVIDTGGFVNESEDVFEIEIAKQVRIAIDEANIIIFMCDVTSGITPLDEDVAELLRHSTKPVLLMVNKVDNNERLLDATEFYSLGMEKIFFVSSMTGSGTGEILDEVISHMLPEVDGDNYTGLPRIAIVGQPNAGKSSLLNALTGKERTIVSEVAGTTRDTIDTYYNQFGKEFVLVDTAGIRKKAKVHEDLEFYSVIRAIKALDECDICMILIDATKGITAQDVSIFSLAARKGKGVVLLVNKWDLIEKETKTSLAFEKEIKEKIAPFTDVPILFISATEKLRIFKAIELAIEVNENRNKKIPTHLLNETLLKEIERYPAPFYRSTAIKMKFMTQLPVAVPSFAFFCNYPDHVKEPYKNFLENKIREKFNFTGVPIRVFFRQK